MQCHAHAVRGPEAWACQPSSILIQVQSNYFELTLLLDQFQLQASEAWVPEPESQRFLTIVNNATLLLTLLKVQRCKPRTTSCKLQTSALQAASPQEACTDRKGQQVGALDHCPATAHRVHQR
jgi:hypothetical protein